MSNPTELVFFMVHGTSSRSGATVRHATYALAEAEARRLAEQNPGCQFVVLKSVRGFRAHGFETTEFQPYKSNVKPPFDLPY